MARITKSQLIRLQKKFHTDGRIGEEFDITRQAVHQLRKKFNIPSRTADNPQRNKDMVTMRKAGKSVEAIARKFKLSIPQTYRILKDNTPRKKASIKKLKAKKLSMKKPSVKKTVKKKKIVKRRKK